MKSNKVLSALYGIALFIALISIVGLLYSSIEMLCYTNFASKISGGGYKLIETYTEFQKPVAITLLVVSVIGIIGLSAGVAYLFVKKPLLKIIFLTLVAAAVVAVIVGIIIICSYWRSYYFDAFYYENYALENDFPHILNSSSTTSSAFVMYSTALSSTIQNLLCFAVIAALLVYDFIMDKKKGNATQEVVEEITE